MRIVFMGTPDFAVPCLKSLLDAGHEVCGVFTQPDKPKGRKQVLTPPPVKELAMEHHIPVYQPTSLKDPQMVETLTELHPDLIAVVAYGRILPKAVLEIPAFGCINVHGSLLPKYRGAAPIQWSVINGDAVTGVTTMYMAEGLDTGDMLLKAETKIGPDETSGELYERLSHMGAALLVETVAGLAKGTLQRQQQDDRLSSYAQMLSKQLSPIDWKKTAQQIHNQVRGLSPWPVASTMFRGKTLKIHQTAMTSEKSSGNPGEITEKNGHYYVCCGDGTLELLSVQYEGSKRMAAADFFRGHPVQPGETVGETV